MPISPMSLAAGTVPGSRHLPCLGFPCRLVEEWEHEGCLPCFWRAVWLPTKGAGISLFLLDPSQTSLGKASHLPWESPARRNPCSARPAPQFPWALVLRHVPDAVGPSRVQGQWRGEVAWRLHPACCLLPGSPRLPLPLLHVPSLQQGTFPKALQRDPPQPTGVRGAPPKLGLTLPPAWS